MGACAFNLAVAHYRSALGDDYPERAGQIAMERLRSAPLDIGDLAGWLLFALGIFLMELRRSTAGKWTIHMSVNAFASIALLAILATFEVRAQHSDSSTVAYPEWNDNSLIAVQKQGGDPTRPGYVTIEFYGHDAFKITSPAGLTVLIDPWRNDPTGLYPKWFMTDFPALRVDIVLSTHAISI